jgi:transcriptional regulator with XRE-family HTH domain
MTAGSRRGAVLGLGERIRLARMLNGWSQDDVVAEIQEQGGRMDRRELSRYETEAATPGAAALLWLSRAMGVTIDSLVVGAAHGA